MKFSTRIRYGVRALLEIAMRENNEGVLQKEISTNQGISLKYLDHIIIALKVSDLIRNVKGKKSGYVLTRPASQISMLDIHNAFEPNLNVVDCLTEGYVCEKRGVCASEWFWCRVNRQVNELFRDTTLQDLIDKQKELDLKKLSVL
ncbi:MAG: Rrf2 family transcriptional regulator [Breznakibacter sp.]